MCIIARTAKLNNDIDIISDFGAKYCINIANLIYIERGNLNLMRVEISQNFTLFFHTTNLLGEK